MPESHLRAADADRMAVAAALGDHMAAGRLTVEEYEERLARAYAAKTYGELAELTADLPGTTPALRPEPVAPTADVVPHGTSPEHTWRAWAATSLLTVAIWVATSLGSWELLYFWPVWVIVPWGAVLLAQSIGGGGGRDRARDWRRRD